MSGRTRERNQAHLVRCSAGCGALVWLAGALPQTTDAAFVCQTCSAAAPAASDSTPSAGASVGAASGVPSERRNGVTKCEATNEAGASCLFTTHAGTVRHLWGDSPERDSFYLGKLQEAVRSFLDRGASREFLATILAETEKGRCR